MQELLFLVDFEWDFDEGCLLDCHANLPDGWMCALNMQCLAVTMAW